MAMNIAESSLYVKHFLTPYHTLCLSANHGVGKSAVVKNVFRKILADKHGIPVEDFAVVDRRASQLDPSDLIGGTWNVGGQTFNAPPYWLPVHEDDQKWLKERLSAAGREWVPFNTSKHGILFLDEVIRGTKLTQQALFELIYDHSVHGIRLPDTWYVIAAINGNLDLYDASRQDPAWTDRLVMVEFYPTKGEYLQYMNEEADAGRIHPSVPSFLYKFEDLIDPDDKIIEENAARSVKGFSRRSWYRLGEAVQKAVDSGYDTISITQKDKENIFLQKAATGHVGDAAAASYSEYVRDEYGTLSAKDILEDFNEITAGKLKGLKASNPLAFGGLNEAIIEELNKKTKLSEKVEKNILRYLELCPREIITSFWTGWGTKSDKCKAQSTTWNTTAVRMSLLIRASAPDKGYDNWLASMTKKFPDFDVTSDERLLN